MPCRDRVAGRTLPKRWLSWFLGRALGLSTAQPPDPGRDFLPPLAGVEWPHKGPGNMACRRTPSGLAAGLLDILLLPGSASCIGKPPASAGFSLFRQAAPYSDLDNPGRRTDWTISAVRVAQSHSGLVARFLSTGFKHACGGRGEAIHIPGDGWPGIGLCSHPGRQLPSSACGALAAG